MKASFSTRNFLIETCLTRVWVLVFSLMLGSGALWGQESVETSGKEQVLSSNAVMEKATSVEAQDLDKKYNDSAEKIRTAIKETQRAGMKYHHGGLKESEKWKEQWQKAGDLGVEAVKDLKSAVIDQLLDGTQAGSAKPPEDIVEIAGIVGHEKFDDGQYEMAYEIASRLAELDGDPENGATAEKVLQARAALVTNRFDEAKGLLTSIDITKADLSGRELLRFGQLDELRKKFQRETAIRETEAKSDDLPRVEFETTQGKIVVELFENEAPQTVANFIALVESGFYQDLVFHRVIRGFMAQTGGFTLTQQKVIRYTIYDECTKDQARTHFRGSLSMATVGGIPNSGSSQFFITFVPTPALDGHHTVFGRVVSDMQVVDSLTTTMTLNDKGEEEPIEGVHPDQILSAKVIRKRDHAYQPVPVTK